MGIVWTYKNGAVGKVLTGTLSDATGAVDLTSKTVTMSARRTKTSGKVLDNVAVAKPFAATGGIAWTVTTDAANELLVPAAEYLLEFKITEGSNVDYFPTDRDGNRTYGKLIVQGNLD